MIEPAGSEPARYTGHIGPVDPDGTFVMLSLEPGDSSVISVPDEAEDVLLSLMSEIGRIVGSSLDLEAVSQRFAISLTVSPN